MPPSGYYRFPTLHADTVIFVCEDDLWSAPVSGGPARRLTSNLGEVTRPSLSADGRQLAFVGLEEGQPEIYWMPASGGQARRLTYLGSPLCHTAGWTPDGRIVFASSSGHWFSRFSYLYTLDPLPEAAPHQPQRLNFGLARSISFGPQGGVVIGRNSGDPAHWKRYRGGTSGRLWINTDPQALAGGGEFRPLVILGGNLTSPMWLSFPTGGPASGLQPPSRIYFLSDHEGIGNLYSCRPSGEDIRRHTDHEDFYARNASTDGQRIVYHAGADLYLFDPASETCSQIPIEFNSPQTQRNRKFVTAESYLESWELHPTGQAVAICARGKIFACANWEGGVLALSEPDSLSAGPGVASRPEAPGSISTPTPTGVRYRLPCWLNDGDHILAVTDEGGEESLVILNVLGEKPPQRLPDLDIGRVVAMAVNPRQDQVVFSNNRYELYFLDLESRALRLIDRGQARPIYYFSWSPDGEWVAYSVSISLQLTALKLWRAETGESFPLTQPVLRDVCPSFDPLGRFIYFISYRIFDPVNDSLQFGLNFPGGARPYLITLRNDTLSPFVPSASLGLPEEDEEEKPEGQEPAQDLQAEAAEAAQQAGEQPEPADAQAEAAPVGPPAGQKRIRIDLDGIEKRIIAFPVPAGRYRRILGTRDGKVIYSSFPVEGALDDSPDRSRDKGTLLVYNFEDQKEEVLAYQLSDFDLSRDGAWLIYFSHDRLRVLKAGEKPDDRNNNGPSRRSGWLDLNRVRVPVLPGAEWRQMFRESWRLQRDHFWTPDMSQVDWLAVHDRYLPLVDRVSSRSEFSDLMSEVQGELGTSHTYDDGGDYRFPPNYRQAFLGADFEYDPQTDSWLICRIVQGDPWDPRANSPLAGPGINIHPGDRLLSINGRRLGRQLSPAGALVNLAGQEVFVSVAGKNGHVSHASLKTLTREAPARYREWVENNRKRVHAATGGRAGYIHIPDMDVFGFAEFHRGYLAEVDRQGLIIDIRFNAGGYVSSLLLEKLARRRLGYDVVRWHQVPIPYPQESVAGPMVALTNEFAGSDGDIFSHSFKLMKLGPLIGKRTWGGVIGVNERHYLVDGTLTRQPEYSFWSSDAGWSIENYGTDPDIEVDLTPQDYARGYDAQLERGIQEIMRLLEADPPQLPPFDARPSRAAPRLPKRNENL